MPEESNKQKPTVSNDNHDESFGQRGDVEPDEIGKRHGVSDDLDDEIGSRHEQEEQRGEAVRSSGNKVHGDKLEGMIPGMSESERANQRPTRDDGDNDDEGELK